MIEGIMFSCQFLILAVDEPTLAEFIMKESGYSEKEFLAEQKKTGHETRKMNKAIREAFH